MKGKLLIRSLSILLTLTLIIIACATTAINTSAANSQGKTVAFNNPAIPANTGETVTLSDYSVEFSSGNATESSAISWSSAEITVTNNKVSPTQKGVYKLTASSGTNSKSVYLVVKAPTDTEYVLYEDDFSTNTLSNYSAISGSCSIVDGKLVLNSKTGGDAYVLLPTWLADFGNYTITSSVNVKEQNDERRWISMMYRVKSASSPFFQMAVRQNASLSDGVELAHNISGSWGYHFQGSYSSALSASGYYTLVLDVYNNKAAASINGTLCGSSNAVTQIDCGNIGLRSNGCIASFDSIKVTARFNALGMPTEPVNIRDIESGITLAPAMIYEIKDKAGLDGILTNSPAVAVMTLNSDGNILASDGNVICTIEQAVEQLNEQVVPAVKLASGCSADTAAAKINALKLKDVMLISDTSTALTAARNASKSIINVYDLSSKNVTASRLAAIRSATLSAGAKICVLPASMATPQNTEFFNTRGVTVWYKTNENTDVEMFNLVTAGANGIITSDRELMEDVLTSSVFKKNSIIRPVSVIGHRGIPSLAPSNTVEGSVYAAQCGANIIENDIFLTTDGVIVIMHDSTIDGTTDGTGNVESFTYEELCRYQITDQPDGSDTDLPTMTDPLPIPTLAEYFEAFKDTDTFLFIEIKSGKQAIVPALKALIDEYDIADQCGVICFGAGMLNAVRSTIPEISVGYLYSESSLYAVMTNTSQIGSSYNPSYSNVNAELVKELSARGVFTWPWTVNNKTDFDKLYLMGVAGITTDRAYYASDYVKYIYTDKAEYTVPLGEAIDIKVTAEKYSSTAASDDLTNDTYNTKKAEMIIISGNETVKYSSGKLSASEAGDATVLFRFAYNLNNGEKAYVYSQPVTVRATLLAQDATDTTDSTDNTEQTTESQAADEPVEESGCGSSVSATAVLGAVMALGFGLSFKKKEN